MGGPPTAALAMVVLAGAVAVPLTACAPARDRPAAATARGGAGPTSGSDSEPAGAAPALAVTGEDLDTVIRSMLAFQDRSLRRPDPSLPRRWIAADSRCLAEQEETHRYLRSRHGHAEVERVVESVRVADRPDPHHALLVVEQRNPGARVWTDGDPTPEVLPPVPSATYPYTLTRDPSTMEWRMSCPGGRP